MSCPSAFAAETSPDIPPKSAALVAVDASTLDDGDEPDPLVLAAHPARVIAARATIDTLAILRFLDKIAS